MTRKSPYPVALVCLLTCALAIPFDALALPDATGQRAGEVSRVIPAGRNPRRAECLRTRPETPDAGQGVTEHPAHRPVRGSLSSGSSAHLGSASTLYVAMHSPP